MSEFHEFDALVSSPLVKPVVLARIQMRKADDMLGLRKSDIGVAVGYRLDRDDIGLLLLDCNSPTGSFLLQDAAARSAKRWYCRLVRGSIVSGNAIRYKMRT